MHMKTYVSFLIIFIAISTSLLFMTDFQYKTTLYNDLNMPSLDSSTFELLAPINGSGLERDTLVTFKWAAVKDAANYSLLIDISKYFNSSQLIVISGINSTQYTLNTSILDQHSYYWKVYAILRDGSLISSEVWVFYVVPKRGPPPQAFSWPIMVGFIIFIVAVFIVRQKKDVF